MSGDFEDQLRRALALRAGDVTPDPALFARVQSRIHRGRMFRLAFAGLAGALAIAAVAVVAPRLMHARVELEPGPVATQPAPEPEPRVTPSPAGGRGPGLPAPDTMVFTDGVSTYLMALDGESATVLWEGDAAVHCPDGDCTSDPAVPDVVVRPGSSRSDLSILYTVNADCPSLVVWGRVQNPDSEDPRRDGGALDGESCVTAPAFSPDGRHVAWLGAAGPDGSWPLSTVDWTGDAPDSDVTGFGLDLPEVRNARLEDWVWTEQSQEEASGYLVVSAGDGGALYRQSIERQGDGALGLTGEPEPLRVAEGYEVVAFADSGDGRMGYTLEVRRGDGDSRIVRSNFSEEGGADVEVEFGLNDVMDLPDDLGGLWLSAFGDTVIFGDGRGEAWLFAELSGQELGQITQVEATVVHADLFAAADAVAEPDVTEPDASQSEVAEPGAQPEGGAVGVELFFGMTGADDCVADRPVQREVEGPGVARGALTQLLEGPTSRESTEGIVSPFNANTAGALNDITIVDGQARVDLRDFSGAVGTDSCTKSAILDSLDQTLLQFPTVNSTRYSFDGSVEQWESWLGSDTEHPAMPPAVADTAQRVRAAAADHDYAALDELMPETFSCTFSDQPEDCVQVWKDQEANGDDPLGALVEILEMEPVRNPDAPIWVWPAAWAEKDYLGPRTGIDENGTWLYYQQGGD